MIELVYILIGMINIVLIQLLALFVYLKKQNKPYTVEQVQELMGSIPYCKIGNSYTKSDRYKDFKQVFDDAMGKKVLSQILDHCDKIVLENESSDHGLLAYRAGKREVATWIIGVMTHQPQQ